MDFEQFAPARDFFYLSALFLGAGCGCILNRFRRKTTTRFRISTITMGLCFFSGAVAALTAAVIFSNWKILFEAELYLPLGIVAAIIVLAFRFPRAVGFPLILVSGLLTVAIGFTCLSFPAVDDSDRVWVNRDGSALIHIRPVLPGSGKTFSPETESASPISFQAAGEHAVLEFRAACFSFSKIIPIVGGVDRAVIAEVLGNGKLLYTNPRPSWMVFTNLYSDALVNEKKINIIGNLFSFWHIQKNLALTELPIGTGLIVSFDGPALTFR